MGLDDWFMSAALVVAIALAIMNGFHTSWYGLAGDISLYKADDV